MRAPRVDSLAAIALVAVALAPAPAARAQATAQPIAARPTEAWARVPFGVGERLVYDVRFGALKVGSGSMEVLGTALLRGREVYHTSFRVKGGTFFYKVHDVYESWFDVRSLASLRHRQDKDEGRYERLRTFEIFPERAVFRENDKPEQPSVDQPLDDGSFLYFVRTIPLVEGETYTFDRYFRPDRNPVTIRVLRRERVTVPAGTFDAVVVQPIIKTKGIFGEGGHAEVWLADDASRMILQLKSELKIGSLNLYLREYRLPTRMPGEVTESIPR